MVGEDEKSSKGGRVIGGPGGWIVDDSCWCEKQAVVIMKEVSHGRDQESEDWVDSK